MAVQVGTGTTIAFGTSGWSLKVRSIEGIGLEVASIDDTHLTTTTARTYRPSTLKDGGTVTCECLDDPSNRPSPTTVNETITVTLPDSSTATFSGHVQSYKISIPLEEMVTGSLSIKVSGTITFA